MEFSIPNYQVFDLNPVLPLSQSVDWGLKMLNIDKIHNEFGLKGKGIKVAVVDSGASHQDIQGGIPNISYRNFRKDGGWNVTNENFSAELGHGTGVCAVIGARNNTIGTLSYAPECILYPIKGMRETGRGYTNEIVDAGYLAKELGVDIVNFSLGSPSKNTAFEKMVKDLNEAGIYVVCAAGNSGKDNDVNYPAAYEEAWAISAINSRGETSAFSSRGWQVECGAPGEKVLTAWKNDGYATISGTSFAAPAVSGIIALFLEAGIKLNKEILKNTSIDIDDPGQDDKSGYGIINPYKIIQEFSDKPESSSTAPAPSSSNLPNEEFDKAVQAYDLLKEYLIQNGVL